MQTKLGSFVEALANIAVGFTINYCANLLIFPLFGFHISLQANVLMGLIYTAISLARSYVLRRWFNGLRFGNREARAEAKPEANSARPLCKKHGSWGSV